MKTEIQPGWMTRETAARWSGLSVRTIDRIVSAGRVHSRLKGRVRLIERESLHAFIDSDEWLDDGRKEDAP